MQSPRVLMIRTIVCCAILPLAVACLSACDSDDYDGDNFGYYESDQDRVSETIEDDGLTSDRDLDRNTGAVDSFNGGERSEVHDSIHDEDDDWLSGGSGGVGGVDDTGRGTGRP